MRLVALGEKQINLLGSLAAVLVLMPSLNELDNFDINIYNSNMKSRAKKVGNDLASLYNIDIKDVLSYMRDLEINSLIDVNENALFLSSAGSVVGGITSILGGFNRQVQDVIPEQESNKDEFAFINEIILKFVKTQDGKQAVFNFAIDNDVELSKINFQIERIALLRDAKLSKLVIWEIIEKIMNYHLNHKFSLNVMNNKSMIFEILSLRMLDDRKDWQELIVFSAKLYQKLSGVDVEYLDELLNLSNRYISVIQDALEIITE